MRWLRGYLLFNGVPGILFVVLNLFFPEIVIEGYSVLFDDGADTEHIMINRFYGAVLFSFTMMTFIGLFINIQMMRIMVIAIILWNVIESYLWWVVVNNGGTAQSLWTHVILAISGVITLAISYRNMNPKAAN